ncbi:MAG: hypothetical protein O2971_11010 [Proteobacteria bacterium]|nr:hypothetical protein [Pseudomonadota bacterium]
MNQLLGSLALLPVEQLLNRFLAADVHTRDQLLRFVDKSLQIQTTAPALTLTILIEPDKIRLLSADAKLLNIEPTAIISGPVSKLVALIVQNSDSRPLANPAIKISGDGTFVQDFYSTLHSLDVDWEDYLAPLLGDVITNEFGQLRRNAQNWSIHANTNLRRNIDDFLKEENQRFPHRDELANFNDELDRLRLRIDRVEARAELLQNRLERLSD